MQAGVMKGPIAVSIDAESTYFQLYSSGILTNATKCGTDLDHAVTVVGYDNHNEDTPYWIVKNSWGTGWGDEGYVYIELSDGDGVCGINKMVSYPNLLMEPHKLEFWTIIGCMSFALFIALPFAIYELRAHIKVGLLHPVKVPFIKTLVFEGVFFGLIWLFYAISNLAAFTNY